MKHIKTGRKRGKFDLLTTTGNVQAAMMTRKPGGASDEEPSNEHRSSEQWLYVISGSGEARIGKTRPVTPSAASGEFAASYPEGRAASDSQHEPSAASYYQLLRPTCI